MTKIKYKMTYGDNDQLMYMDSKNVIYMYNEDGVLIDKIKPNQRTPGYRADLDERYHRKSEGYRNRMWSKALDKMAGRVDEGDRDRQ